MSLVNQVSGDSHADHLRYIELLRANDNTPENVAELRQLMVRLNRTDEQVAIDASIIRRGDALRTHIRGGLHATLTAKKLAQDVFKDETPHARRRFVEAQEAALKQWKIDRDAALEPLQAEHDAAHADHDKAVKSIAAFNQLKRENPALFADQPMKTPSDIA